MALLAEMSTTLVYPFTHSIEGMDHQRRIETLSGRWCPWWERLSDEDRRRAIDSSYFFLAHIRRLLFPEVPPQGEAVPVAMDSLAGFAARVSPERVLHLTLDPAQLHPMQSPVITYRDFCIPCAMRWIDLWLFPRNVGFFALHLDVGNIPIESAVEFLHHARLVQPPALDWEVPAWTVPGVEPFTADGLVGALLQGLAGGKTNLLPPLKDAVHAGSSSAVQGEYHAFRLYTYASLHSDPDHSASDPDPFESDEDRVLYELATATHTHEPDYEPDPKWLSRLLDIGRFAFWSNWKGMALHDNVVFLATRQTHFTHDGLARNVESDYFPLYLLTLYQKVWLGMLASEFSQSSQNLYGNASHSRTLRASFVSFRTNFWFAEVTQRPQGLELYKRFREGLDVLPLYESIDSTVHELDEFYERRVQARIGTVLTLLTVVGVPAGVLSQIYAPYIAINGSFLQFVIVTAVVYLAIALGWLFWRRRGRL